MKKFIFSSFLFLYSTFLYSVPTNCVQSVSLFDCVNGFCYGFSFSSKCNGVTIVGRAFGPLNGTNQNYKAPSSSGGISNINDICPFGYFYDDTFDGIVSFNEFGDPIVPDPLTVSKISSSPCKQICSDGFSWNGTGCVSLCSQNETYVNGSCQCFPNMTRGSNGVCSSCPTGTNMFPNSVCYGPCPTGTSEASSPVTKSQLCLATSGNVNAFFSRKNADGTLDVIKGDGSFIRYDKDGKPVVAYDNQGNAINVSDYSVRYPNSRGSIFNPIIASGLIGSGYLITAAGFLAGSGAGLPGALMLTAGAFMMAGGGGVAAYSYLKDISGNPVPVSSAGQQGITLDISNFDTSGGGSALAPTSTTQNANGSITKVYKPNANTTITETEYYDGVVEYVTQDKTTNTTTAFSVKKSDLADKGETTLQPKEIPITQYTPNADNSVTTPNATYIPDIATGGVIPANPQSSGGGTTGGGVSDPAGGTTGGSSSSGGGTMQDGQTSGAAGTDGNSTTDGQGKDFGSEFGDFSAFKTWDEILGSLDNFKGTVSSSFDNLKNSINDMKNTFQDGDGKSKINASLGSGSADSCPMSFTVFGRTVDFSSGLSQIAPKVRPFVSFLVFIFMTIWSVRRVYIMLRGGAS